MDWELWASTLLAILVSLLFNHILLVPRSKLRILQETAFALSITPNEAELRFSVENVGEGMGHLRPLVTGTAHFEGRVVEVEGIAYRSHSPGVQVEPFVGPVAFEVHLRSKGEAVHGWLGAPGLLRLEVQPSRNRWWFRPGPLRFEAPLDDESEPIEP